MAAPQRCIAQHTKTTKATECLCKLRWAVNAKQTVDFKDLVWKKKRGFKISHSLNYMLK